MAFMPSLLTRNLQFFPQYESKEQVKASNLKEATIARFIIIFINTNIP